MANSIITDLGKNVILDRSYISSPSYTVPSKFKVGVNQATPSSGDTDITYPIPVENGTVNDDGSNTLTGSSGGDNSTDNTTRYKAGAGLSDNTAQNLIANNTNAIKIWTIANLAAAGTNATATYYTGLWLYISDSTTLAKFKSSGTCLEIKLGSDSSNYYSITFELTDLSTGWNWITDSGVLNTWTETGTVSGNIDTFIIQITTNNATDQFTTGNVVFDLLRQWQESDLYFTYSSGYPVVNEVANTVTMRGVLTSVKANGFPLTGLGNFNTDTPSKLTDVDKFDEESKDDTDEIVFELVNGW